MSGRTMILRATDDANFAHTVGLLGAVGAWAESIEEGHVVQLDDINMIQIGVEVALAFVEEHSSDQTPLGEACRRALDTLAAFREVPHEKTESPDSSGEDT